MFTIAVAVIAATLGFLLCAVLTVGKIADLHSELATKHEMIADKNRTIEVLRNALNRGEFASAEIVPLHAA